MLAPDMNAITLDFPIESLPGLPVRDGLRFRGLVRGDRLEVTLEAPAPAEAKASAAAEFVEKWRGRGTLLPPEELESDPRLAALTAKHLR